MSFSIKPGDAVAAKSLLAKQRGRWRRSVPACLVLLSVLGSLLYAGRIMTTTPRATAAIAPGGPWCATFSAAIYALNDTGSYSATPPIDPYDSPAIGYSGPSRDHISVNVAASSSSALSGCSAPNPLSSFTTDYCPANSGACPPSPKLWGGPGDASKVSLSPPPTAPGRDRNGNLTTVTFIGATWEPGPPNGGKLDADDRNFPTSAQVTGPAVEGFRLILHYTDCADPAAPSHCPSKPYLSVYGGDVAAGSGFGEGCSATNGSAKIITFNRGNGAYPGAGTQMAAFALSTITQFTSAGGGGSRAPKTLSFSNTSGGTYGGDFGHTYCAPNYWEDAPTSPAPPSSQTINGASVGDGAHAVVYVDGDATITNDIVYAGSGSWTGLSQIPSYYLIVRGNIYINKNVQRLDGTYVAMPDSSGHRGIIYTCTNGSTPYSGTLPAGGADCGKKLSINGAFIANSVKFLRTNGDVLKAVAGEASSSTNIAETFVYGPEIWVR